MMFSSLEIKALENRGISLNQAENQLKKFRTGFPYLKIIGPASPGKGILAFSPDDENKWIHIFDGAREKLDIIKFVPASGAASRMFKNLFELLNISNEKIPGLLKEHPDLNQIFNNIEKFAFYPALLKCIENQGVTSILHSGDRDLRKIATFILEEPGLNYGSKPKGLVQFHKYKEGSRTPVEEHFMEAILYAMGKNNTAHLHFTVSQEHLDWFKRLSNQLIPIYENKFAVHLELSFSFQDPATDTLAVDMENKPFKTNQGKLLFRPGGHGALLNNLNALDSDILFIKNIDNVVPDRRKEVTVRYKKVLAGVLLFHREKIFSYLNQLEKVPVPDKDLLNEIQRYLQDDLNVHFGDIRFKGDREEQRFLYNKLNRPIRVCGMVKNQGEPGGGPFFSINPDGTQSLQILETSQIDLSKPENKKLLMASTHFNPVDLACSLRDYKGQKFNLPDFCDENTGFISVKSKDGRNLKALELPGLWNGAMADWNTFFVEVPIETFNPVKTINDLLRPEHQV